jgi:SAM-dependent methyltransferase
VLDTLLQLQKTARIHAYALIGEGGDVSYTPGVGTVDRGKCIPIGAPKRKVRYHNLLDVLEHRLQPERLVSEASRVLRRGGLFVLAITNLGDIYSRIAFRFGYTPFRYDPSTCKVDRSQDSESRSEVTKRIHVSTAKSSWNIMIFPLNVSVP